MAVRVVYERAWQFMTGRRKHSSSYQEETGIVQFMSDRSVHVS
jgi:hypothetical protein